MKNKVYTATTNRFKNEEITLPQYLLIADDKPYCKICGKSGLFGWDVKGHYISKHFFNKHAICSAKLSVMKQFNHTDAILLIESLSNHSDHWKYRLSTHADKAYIKIYDHDDNLMGWLGK